MTEAPRIRIDPSERLIALGRTGAGKTQWTKSMLRAVNKNYPIVIVDPKAFWLGRNPVWAGKREKGTVDKPRLVTQFDKKIADKRGVQLVQFDAINNLADLNKLCDDILEYARTHGEIFVNFDECEGIATATKTPIGVNKLWKQGRGLGVGAWVGNQRSLGIPEIFKSQAEAFVVFDLPGERDRKDVAYYVHTPEVEAMETVPPFHYWYFHRKLMRHAELMPPLDLSKQIKKETVKE